MFVPTFLKASPKMLAGGFALTLSFSTSAYALEANQFVDTLENGIRLYGLTLDYKGRDLQNETVTLKEVRLLQPLSNKGPGSLPIYLGTVTFSGIKAEKDGSFDIEKIVAGEDSDFDAEDVMQKAPNNPGQVIIHKMDIMQAHISPKDTAYKITQYLPYQNIKIENVTYKLDGKIILSLDDISGQYQKQADGIYQSISKVDALTYDPASWPGEDGADAKEMLDALGYDKIKGNFTATTIWNPQKGNLDISEYKFTADNAGTLSLSGKLSGVTEDFANNYQKLAFQQMEASQEAKQQQEISKQALALATQLSFNNFRIVYEDNSLANRILDYMSKSTGKSRQELISLLKASVLANSHNLKNTAFANHAVEQINAFLDHPKSFQITADPQTPAAFASILLGLSISPEQLITILGLDVEANK